MKVVIALIALLLVGCRVVDTGQRGLRVEFGKVVGDPLPEGLYFYNPIVASIVQLSVQEQKVDGKTACFTKDNQNVIINFTLTYYPDPSKIGEIYKQFGRNWEEKVINPAILGSIKDSTGKYIADDLVGKREEAKNMMFSELKDALSARNVYATRLDLTNLDFDDAYEKAVEEKVVAVQKALEAKNKTVQIQEEARQKILSAQAEAESMRIRSSALSQNKGLVQYEAVQKWDGKLPTYMLGNSVPFINLEKAN